MPAPSNGPPRVGFVRLGCAKATVDTERLVTRLRSEGYEVAPSYAAEAPGIDGVVYVSNPGKAGPGDLLDVRIKASGNYDLQARVGPATDAAVRA